MCRKGPVKGAKDVGLSEKSKPRFKRNTRKPKANKRKEKVAAKGKTATTQAGESGSGTDIGVRVGNKRTKIEGKQEREKHFRGTWELWVCAHLELVCVYACSGSEGETAAHS